MVITDGVSAASVLLYPAGSWRMRHLRLRCRAYQEMIEEELLTLAHVKGQYQLADLLTKALRPQRVTQLLEYIGCVEQPVGEEDEDKNSAGGFVKENPKGIAKSLVVLSFFLSPVKAQPTERIGLEESQACWFGHVLCSALLVIRYAAVTKQRRLEDLKEKASVVPGDGDDDDSLLEPWEQGESVPTEPSTSQKGRRHNEVRSNGEGATNEWANSCGQEHGRKSSTDWRTRFAETKALFSEGPTTATRTTCGHLK